MVSPAFFASRVVSTFAKGVTRILDSIFEKEDKSKELIDMLDKIDEMKKSILARAFRDLQEFERHYDRNWKLLCQTLETLTKRVTTPSHLAYAEAIYAVVKPWLLGTAALCDWEGA